MIYQEHAHCKLRQAFDAILQQFSSNGNRKSMLSANRSSQAQNSTCSTLLQTVLLYETCIVLSRKCLWDVNKDFWHQWRSLVITTLLARAIYRQIPVSYLQTWYTWLQSYTKVCKISKVESLKRIFAWIMLFHSYPGFPEFSLVRSLFVSFADFWSINHVSNNLCSIIVWSKISRHATTCRINER